MNSNTTPTPRTNQARHTAFNGQKTDYEAYLYMAYVAETIEIELAEKTNEVSNYHQHYRDEASKAQKCKQAFIEQEKEVARLRELLNRAIEIADGLVDPFIRITGVPEHELVTLKAEVRLAPPTEPAPEWRELGEDEVICEGDEFNQKGSYDWGKCGEYFLGQKVWEFIHFHPLLQFRTRRPLPNSHESEGIKKQEEMPLVDEIKRIETRDAWIDPTKDIITCIRYLRDEIQKLKQIK